MAKRAQRLTNEPELEFELRKIGYLKRGLADLPGTVSGFTQLLELLVSGGAIRRDDPAPLSAAASVMKEAIEEVTEQNESAGSVLSVLYALDQSVRTLTAEGRYQRAASAFGSRFERAKTPGSRSHAFNLLATTLRVRWQAQSASVAEAKFVTLDDPSVPNAPEVLRNASLLRVRSRSGAALLNSYTAPIREMLAAGGELRLLTLKPGSPAADQAYGSARGMFEVGHKTAVACVELLLKDVPGAAITWRETAEPTSISQIIATLRGAPAMSLVQVNLVYGAQGRLRPVIVFKEDDQWFIPFADEFDHIWERCSIERRG